MHDAVVVEYVVPHPTGGQAVGQGNFVVTVLVVAGHFGSGQGTVVNWRIMQFAWMQGVEIGAQVVGTTEDVVVGQLARLRSLTGDAVARMLWTG